MPDLIFDDNYTAVIERLENEELEQKLSLEAYLQLAALYLYRNDFIAAKLLIERIPLEMKTDNKTIARMQLLLTALLKNNYIESFKALFYSWPEHINGIMNEVIETVRRGAFDLIGTAYSSIYEQNLMEFTQMPREQLLQICNSLNWTIEQDGNQYIIFPKRATPPPVPTESSEDQLKRLTTFVTFLET